MSKLPASEEAKQKCVKTEVCTLDVGHEGYCTNWDFRKQEVSRLPALSEDRPYKNIANNWEDPIVVNGDPVYGTKVTDGPAEGIATERERCEVCMWFLPNHHPTCFRKSEPVEPAAPVVQPKKYCVDPYCFGDYCGLKHEASQSAPVVVRPEETENLYFFEAGPDGARSEVLPESKLKQAVHDSMCMCGMDWQACGSDGVSDTCEAIDDDSEWNSASDIKRWSWGQDFEDGCIRIIRLLSAQPAPLPSDDSVILESQRNALFEVVKGIANANWRFWGDGLNTPQDFVTWAKSIASRAVEDVEKIAQNSPAALPVGQKETFEEWLNSVSDGDNTGSASATRWMRRAWNAAKGQKETK
jgi:hypothetical protein